MTETEAMLAEGRLYEFECATCGQRRFAYPGYDLTGRPCVVCGHEVYRKY